MRLSRHDIGTLAVVAVSGAVGIALFGPQRVVHRNAAVEAENVVQVEVEKVVETENVVVIRTDGRGEGEPLVYVDGVRFVGELDAIDPDEIDRIDVLKGEAALERYGPEAAAGVVLIVLKEGGSGS